MAKRQALRELQERLAQRLQQARSEGVSAGWLAVEMGELSCLIPLSQAGEIFPIVSSQHVPYTQYWYLGVANLRGGLYGVIDLHAFISGTSTKDHKSTLAKDQARLIAFNTNLEANCAIWIDRLSGLRNAQDFKSRSPAQSGSPAFIQAIYIDQFDKTWMELDLQALVQTPEFLSIGAH